MKKVWQINVIPFDSDQYQHIGRKIEIWNNFENLAVHLYMSKQFPNINGHAVVTNR